MPVVPLAYFVLIYTDPEFGEVTQVEKFNELRLRRGTYFNGI